MIIMHHSPHAERQIDVHAELPSFDFFVHTSGFVRVYNRTIYLGDVLAIYYVCLDDFILRR